MMAFQCLAKRFLSLSLNQYFLEYSLQNNSPTRCDSSSWRWIEDRSEILKFKYIQKLLNEKTQIFL